VAYVVDLTARAERDLAEIYERVHAAESATALRWFERLEREILTLQEHPHRCALTPESKIRHLLYGHKPRTYRAIYVVSEEPNRVVVLPPWRKARIQSPRSSISAPQSPLQFRLTSLIIRVCLDLAGLFRNKDIRLVLMIRLARRGARKQPHYRIVVIEKERARNGRPVEVVGTYNPRTNPASVELKRERVEYWVSKGAQMSERVNKLFTKAPAPVSAA
jgi:small subunit ribosomal protein S16